VAAEIEEEENSTTTVLGLYKAMKMVSRRRVASQEGSEARAGGRKHAWKAFEARRHRREVACGGWRRFQINYRIATGGKFQITFKSSIEVENK
jgi:hypothetical protein